MSAVKKARLLGWFHFKFAEFHEFSKTFTELKNHALQISEFHPTVRLAVSGYNRFQCRCSFEIILIATSGVVLSPGIGHYQ